MAVLAMLAGLVELMRVPEGPAMRAAYWHMAAMTLAFSVFTTRLLLGVKDFSPIEPNAVLLWLDAAGFATLAVGGWLGGQLVYEHGVGQTPK